MSEDVDYGFEASAMAYIHVKQLALAVKNCSKKDINCQLKFMKKSAPDSTMSFVRWDGKSAVYDFTLKERKNGETELVRSYN